MRDLLDRLPLDHPVFRKVPIPGLQAECLLELDLGRGVAEAAPDSPIAALQTRHTPVLRTLVDGLARAVGDDRVVGLVAHIGPTRLGLTQAAEVATAVRAFRASGKPTLAWTESFGELTSGLAGYLAATAFEEIWLQPSGDLGLVGAAVEATFLRGALDKLGVEPQVAQRREYKSAAETFTNESMSGPNREMLQRILTSIVETSIERIAAARDLEPDTVREAIDRGPLRAAEALERGLVDHLGYRDEAHAAIRARLGEPVGKRAELRFVERYRKLPGVGVVTGRGRPVVAVVPAHGPVHLGRGGPTVPFASGSIGSDSLGAALREAGRQERVAAAVLRVDSPGGSYVASDAIRREVLALRETGIPVVASMASVAGSGGYYIAMGCTEIVAGAATLTGSIGVLAGKQVIARGLARIGVNREIVSSGRNAAMFSSQQPFDEEQWRRLEEWLDIVYADFTAKAAQDRRMSVEGLEPHARGRVWTGADARERGLVDSLGGLSHAIDRACALAGLDRAAVDTRVVPKPSPLDRLLPTENSDGLAAAATGEGPLLQRAAAAVGLAPVGVLTMPPVRLA